MNKPRIIAALTAGLIASLAVIPIFASAQGSMPPAPPLAIIHGSAQGATPGQHVVAFVESSAGVTACGSGSVVSDSSAGTVYVVDVESNSSVPGCGAPGRVVRLYFGTLPGLHARFANQTVTLGSAAFQEHQVNVSFGTPLSNRLLAPHVASHVSR